MKIRETSYFPSWIGRQTKLKPTNRAHILDIFNTYYGNRVESDSIVFHRGSFYRTSLLDFDDYDKDDSDFDSGDDDFDDDHNHNDDDFDDDDDDFDDDDDDDDGTEEYKNFFGSL